MTNHQADHQVSFSKIQIKVQFRGRQRLEFFSKRLIITFCVATLLNFIHYLFPFFTFLAAIPHPNPYKHYIRYLLHYFYIFSPWCTNIPHRIFLSNSFLATATNFSGIQQLRIWNGWISYFWICWSACNHENVKKANGQQIRGEAEKKISSSRCWKVWRT